jgi:hypothetical protein
MKRTVWVSMLMLAAVAAVARGGTGITLTVPLVNDHRPDGNNALMIKDFDMAGSMKTAIEKELVSSNHNSLFNREETGFTVVETDMAVNLGYISIDEVGWTDGVVLQYWRKYRAVPVEITTPTGGGTREALMGASVVQIIKLHNVADDRYNGPLFGAFKTLNGDPKLGGKYPLQVKVQTIVTGIGSPEITAAMPSIKDSFLQEPTMDKLSESFDRLVKQASLASQNSAIQPTLIALTLRDEDIKALNRN